MSTSASEYRERLLWVGSGRRSTAALGQPLPFVVAAKISCERLFEAHLNSGGGGREVAA